MNLFKWVVGGITAILIALGLNYVFNPAMDEDEELEYWELQEEVMDAELKTMQAQDRIETQKDKLKNRDKSLLDKIKDEWEKK